MSTSAAVEIGIFMLFCQHQFHENYFTSKHHHLVGKENEEKIKKAKALGEQELEICYIYNGGALEEKLSYFGLKKVKEHRKKTKLKTKKCKNIFAAHIVKHNTQ
mmetsp:Transcript_13074/g.19019  ORF Transcript_13074/g.19019 Transcript_13074/m.19019 type:complete len:104 (-) Transcript_13074:81-392(-)